MFNPKMQQRITQIASNTLGYNAKMNMEMCENELDNYLGYLIGT